MMVVKFPLRPESGIDVEVTMPKSISHREAVRLSNFMLTLATGDGGAADETEIQPKQEGEKNA